LLGLRWLCLSLLCCMGYGTESLAVNNGQETYQSLFSQAEEDYRFSDFESALPRLEVLHQRRPEDATVVRYLAESYMAQSRVQEALNLYGQWLLTQRYQHSDKTRFAWLGMSHALLQLKQREGAMRSLKQWVSYHPDDYVAAIMYGGLLVQAEQYDAANPIWQRIIGEAGSSEEDKAAAYYFQALHAFLKGDFSAQKRYAQASLKMDAEGAYADLSKALLVSKPARALGLNGQVSLHSFYSSNVELLPDFQAPALNKRKNDVVNQLNAMLLYNFPEYSVRYVFSEGFHVARSDLDLAYHSLSALWAYKYWAIKPRLEFAQLGGHYLFQSEGADISLQTEHYRWSYGLRLKQFNHNFNGSSLAHLGGVSQSLSISRAWKLSESQLLGSMAWLDEATQGNATVGKSDAYRQWRMQIQWLYPLEQWSWMLMDQLYIRSYRMALPNSNLPVRQDVYHQVQLAMYWKHKPTSAWKFTGDMALQNNASNDATKRFKEWRLGLKAEFQW